MAERTFSYRLDLIVRLLDTTTGIPVPQRQVVFMEHGRVLAFLERDVGLYVLLNHGRENTTLHIDVRGFEPVDAVVDYGRLDPQFPQLEIALIPLPREQGFDDLYTLTGQKQGITAISAIRTDDPAALVANYVERKQVLKLFTARDMAERTYGLVHKDRQQFEEITVARRLDRLSLKLLWPLTDGWRPEEPLTRIVRGRVTDEAYLLRVRDMGTSNTYLVRYETTDGALYEQIDFSLLDREERTWD